MSKKLDLQYPNLAGKLFAAFQTAKQLAYEDILDDRSGFSLVDLRERFLAQIQDWGDLFPNGIAANKHTINTFMSYCREYGIVKDAWSYETVFAASTLNT
jgi:hypothetical protein